MEIKKIIKQFFCDHDWVLISKVGHTMEQCYRCRKCGKIITVGWDK